MRTKPMDAVKFKIGPVVIEIASRFPLVRSDYLSSPLKYYCFIYRGRQPAQIRITVFPRRLAPAGLARGRRILFTHFHHERKETAWVFSGGPKDFVVDFYLSARKKIMTVNKTYTKAAVYLDERARDFSWELEDILYDCLQMVFIGYCADKGGVLVHSAGLCDDALRRGCIFAGCSGAGKSTTARFWHGRGRARVLNDDRIFVQEKGRGFLLFGTPWHGNFSDYPESIAGSTVLNKIFFISHAVRNNARALAGRERFIFLYPNIFLAFWDRKLLDHQVDLCRRLSLAVPAWHLGLVKDKSAVDFVRSIK